MKTMKHFFHCVNISHRSRVSVVVCVYGMYILYNTPTILSYASIKQVTRDRI